MRLSHILITAGALFAAAPAVAQNNTAVSTNSTTMTTTTTTDANAMSNEADLNAAAVPPQSVDASPAVATPADSGTTMAVKTHRGFPFGVIGLLGLIGLMGVRKVKS